MATILFIGDPHLKITRFDLAKKFLAWTNSVVDQVKPDIVVNLGDTFDTHAVIRSEVTTEFMNHVRYVRDRKIPYFYLLGNHDMYKPNDSTYHALLPFKGEVAGLTIIDSIFTHPLGITFVPYQHNPSTFPLQTERICVAHQTFKGADYGDITTQDGVDASLVSAEVIVSGHIHKRQQLGKVYYPGSPFSQSLNDINQVKGLVLFDTDTYAITEIPNPLPQWRGMRIELSSTFSYEDACLTLEKTLNEADHWHVEFTGPKAEVTALIDSERYQGIVSGKDVKISTSFTDKEKKLVRIEALTMENIISEYLLKVYSGTLDKKLLQEKALDILKTVQNR
jgi:DNA repair exonuclease SbcCD nuclease subunit